MMMTLMMMMMTMMIENGDDDDDGNDSEQKYFRKQSDRTRLFNEAGEVKFQFSKFLQFLTKTVHICEI